MVWTERYNQTAAMFAVVVVVADREKLADFGWDSRSLGVVVVDMLVAAGVGMMAFELWASLVERTS